MAWAFFDRKQSESGEWSGFLEQGVRFEGKLEAPGTFRVDGQVKGSIISEVALILGEHASVEGEVTGNAVTVAGRFEGIMRAHGRVDIQTKAIVSGEIHTPSLAIEPGAVVEGVCHVVGATDGSTPIMVPIRSVIART